MRHLAVFIFLASLAFVNCLEAAGWSVFERTNIQGTISGTVRQGTILKTTSGRIYEVTGLTLQLVLELQPKALVLANGNEYKLIIEGFDDPLICKLLSANSKASPNLPAANLIKSRIKGEFEGWDGETIFQLDNGQVWEQAAYAYHYHYAFRPEVTIFKSGNGHAMKVDGVSKTIAVRLISGTVVRARPAAKNITISRIDTVRSVIELSDGSVWSVAKIHQKKVAEWRRGDKISITKYKGVMVLTKTKNQHFAFATKVNGPRKAADNQDAPVKKKAAGNQDALVKKLLGAKIYSQEKPPKYLGKISGEFDRESIFNEFGPHGGEFAQDSIWNEFGTYGGEFSAHSPFHEFTATPPMIVSGNKIIGYLTVNTLIRGGISPYTVKGLMK